jgi:hypothetical protein
MREAMRSIPPRDSRWAVGYHSLIDATDPPSQDMYGARLQGWSADVPAHLLPHGGTDFIAFEPFLLMQKTPRR